MEGPCVVYRAPMLQPERKKILGAPLLAFVQGAGACADRKSTPKMLPWTLPPPAKSARGAAPGKFGFEAYNFAHEEAYAPRPPCSRNA